MSLVLDAKDSGVKIKIIYSASVFDVISETGLQLYKFGKIISMPKWEKSYETHSFLESVEENQSISSHSLILIDIGLSFRDAIEQFEETYREAQAMYDALRSVIGL